MLASQAAALAAMARAKKRSEDVQDLMPKVHMRLKEAALGGSSSLEKKDLWVGGMKDTSKGLQNAVYKVLQCEGYTVTTTLITF